MKSRKRQNNMQNETWEPAVLSSQETSISRISPQDPEAKFYVGVDVGTGSARACVIDQFGNMLSLAEKPIKREQLISNFITQSSREIWNAVCYCVRTVVEESGVDPERVRGIGFDATCSLVVVSATNFEEIAVGPDFTNNDQNIILWMDHRAMKETEEINSSGDKCLKYVGGQMSVEMEIPKIKWLKNNLEAGIFQDCKFFDLPDYLTFKATGKENRSFCSAVCKQGFLPVGVEGSDIGWSKEFLNSIGLSELTKNNFERLGGSLREKKNFLTAGECISPLDKKAACQLGLTEHCVVSSGIIDAYAGWVGTVAAKPESAVKGLAETENYKKDFNGAIGRLAAVAGTSTCHILLSKNPIFVHGVWGPYRDVLARGFWAAEGGQSCTGVLLDHLITTHPAFTELSHMANLAGVSKFEYLNKILETLVEKRKVRSVISLAKHLFFYGDYHGNRSPIADPNMRACIIGQSMDNSIKDLAVMYLSACEFISQQTRQIIEVMLKSGHEINAIFMSGGQCRNSLLMRLLADCTGLPIVIPRYVDAAVVFGSALLGAAASEDFDYTREKRTLKGQKSSQTKTERFNDSYSSIQKLSMEDRNSTNGFVSPHNLQLSTPSAPAKINNYSLPICTQQPLDKTSEESSKDASLTVGQESLGEGRYNGTSFLWKVMQELTGNARIVNPNEKTHPDRILLDTKYQIFLDMIETQRKYRRMVDKVEGSFSR
ncbi:BCE_3a_G0009920.mRNA.1.CDS.1 [Saccharomyces cerevisiae]|nr:BCE_3a_G0009920.mRNA.1.CDS.1 [Saccharomyces cerevisiae]CAI7072226.1 BCE_3a_G0009920.mRNA.1.CDS.1 [Saccharomyces cerevisiae]